MEHFLHSQNLKRTKDTAPHPIILCLKCIHAAAFPYKRSLSLICGVTVGERVGWGTKDVTLLGIIRKGVLSSGCPRLKHIVAILRCYQQNYSHNHGTFCLMFQSIM